MAFDARESARGDPQRPPAGPPVTWTADLVRDVLLEALRWNRRHGGPAGGRGFVTARLDFRPTDQDRAREGWGISEVAGDVEEAPQVHPLDMVSPERQRLFRRALEWQLDHLRGHTADAAVLAAWLASRVGGQKFEAELEGRGIKLARNTAYRVRDRALGRIASALKWTGVPLPGED